MAAFFRPNSSLSYFNATALQLRPNKKQSSSNSSIKPTSEARSFSNAMLRHEDMSRGPPAIDEDNYPIFVRDYKDVSCLWSYEARRPHQPQPHVAKLVKGKKEPNYLLHSAKPVTSLHEVFLREQQDQEEHKSPRLTTRNDTWMDSKLVNCFTTPIETFRALHAKVISHA